MSPLIEKARALVEASRRRIHPCVPRHIGAQVRSWAPDALEKSEEKTGPGMSTQLGAESLEGSIAMSKLIQKAEAVAEASKLVDQIQQYVNTLPIDPETVIASARLDWSNHSGSGPAYVERYVRLRLNALARQWVEDVLAEAKQELQAACEELRRAATDHG